jgi:uncharacterized protein YbjT (DUF2867 family)
MYDRTNLVTGFVDECQNVKMIVFVSAFGADKEFTILGKEASKAEKHIRASGIPYCFLRMVPIIVSSTFFVFWMYIRSLTFSSRTME